MLSRPFGPRSKREWFSVWEKADDLALRQTRRAATLKLDDEDLAEVIMSLLTDDYTRTKFFVNEWNKNIFSLNDHDFTTPLAASAG